MITKYPLTDNIVTGNSRITPRRAERGIALISVVGVLVLLGLIVTPFMMTQRDSALRGDRLLYNARADAEAESLFQISRSELMRSVEQVEYERLSALGAANTGSAAEGESRPPENATPSSDTLSEFALSPEILARFNQQTENGHRVWDAKIIDLQSVPNLNSCSAPFLANVLGRSELTDTITADTDTIPVGDASVFPEAGGVVRIGAEAVKYKQVVGNTLTGCERGYGSDKGTSGPPTGWETGDAVFLEAAVQLAMRPFTARPGRWVHYTNIYQARSIADGGLTALPPDRFDRLREQVGVFSGNVVGDGWCNPQLVKEAVAAGTTGMVDVDIKNLRYVGPGTIVRMTDGVNSDYAMVAKVKGDKKLTLLGNFKNGYEADQTYLYSLSRSPVNLNTATVGTLALVFDGLRLRGRPSSLDRNRATNLAQKLKEWKSPDDAGAAPGTYRNWEDLTRALESIRDSGDISVDEMEAVMRNAMNANDSQLQFSTVPFCFRSYDLFEVRATATILADDGREVARREVRRVMSAGTGRTGVLKLESQDDFQRQIMKSRDAKWWATFPDNVNAQYDGVNVPASEYQAFMNRSRFPSTSRASSEGDLQLLPGSWRFVGREDRVHHFDESDVPDGQELEEGGFNLKVSDTFSKADKTIDLVNFVEIPNRGQEIETGVRPFSLSFWYRPRWNRNGGDQTIFDYGDDDDFMNRISLRYLNDRDMLVLAVADATREQRAYEVFYDFKDHLFEADRWYHIAVDVRGAGPGLLDLFVDGESVGEATGVTRLTAQVPADGTTIDLNVESTKSFPDDGVLMLSSEDGIEFMEYASKNDTSFRVVRRKARNINATQATDKPRAHPKDTIVELYGYSAPLFTDIRRAGGTLPARIGPWRVYRIAMPQDTNVADRIDIVSTGTPPSVTTIWGIGSTTSDSDAVNGVPLLDWETGANDATILQDLGAPGAEGLALLVSGNTSVTYGSAALTISQGPHQGEMVDNQIGRTAEIVRYRVGNTAGTVDIVQRRVDLKHTTSEMGSTGSPYFIPTHDYGDPASPQSNADGNGNTGWMSAFVPIGLIAQGSNADYLDPLDEEPQLDFVQGQRYAYVQIDGEWVKYDTFDTSIVPGSSAFYRDQRLDDVAGLFGAVGLQTLQPVDSPSTGNKGGPGGPSSSGNVPPRVDNFNDESNLPAEASGAPLLAEPIHLSRDIATRLDFRGYIKDSDDQDFRIANTIPRVHEANTDIIPAFRILAGNDFEPDAWLNQTRGAHAGWNDLCTLRDIGNSDQQVRVAWGYGGWAALSENVGQTWGWDRPSDQRPDVVMRRYDARAFTRLVKFPSGELPDSKLTLNQETFAFGVPYNGGGVSPCTLDEVFIPKRKDTPDDRVAYGYLGAVPKEVIQIATGSVPTTGGGTQIVNPRFPGIDAEQDSFKIHLTTYDDSSQAIVVSGLPIAEDVFPEDGGIIRIDDELILYSELDLESGEFSGCLRGTFGTQSVPHPYNARVSSVQSFPCSVLTSPMDDSSASYELQDTSDFPDDGYVRIADAAEILGYTERDGNALSGPLGRIDPTTVREGDTDARVGGALFRGRFGTKPETYVTGDVVVAMPFRYYDRYAERSDHPEMSYVQFSWSKPGAIWKRVSWAQKPIENAEIIALLRFSGGPPWDSDQIVQIGADEIPKVDRRSKIYQISATSKNELNLLNVEADRLEVRLLVRYADGAYRRIYDLAGGEPLPNSWKESPWVKKVSVEYVAPTLVLSQE